VRFVSNRDERVRPGATYVTDAGELTIVAARPHGGRHLVRFEGVLDRSAAEALRGLVLAAAPIDDPGELWVHDLVGSTVVDRQGTERGVVTAVVDNPASDLLELDTGRLVPLTFVVEVDPGHTVVVDAPPGLFD
jgi:16S rRNA processing protein RimM